MALIIPEPPSANRYWRHTARGGRAITYKSAKAKQYQSEVRTRAMLAGLQPLNGPVEVHLVWYRKARRGDLDNRLKVIFDALQGAAYVDDSQIVAITARREEDKNNPRVEIVVRPRDSHITR